MARAVFDRIGLAGLTKNVENFMYQFREIVGREAFMKEWEAIHGNTDLPDWLAE